MTIWVSVRLEDVVFRFAFERVDAEGAARGQERIADARAKNMTTVEKLVAASVPVITDARGLPGFDEREKGEPVEAFRERLSAYLLAAPETTIVESVLGTAWIEYNGRLIPKVVSDSFRP
jgi:hypothetical protein